MRDVSIVGIGQIPVKEHWETSLRHLAYQAMQMALTDAGLQHVEALYVGNMLSDQISRQQHLGSLLADFAGLRGIEAMRIEAADASGAAAFRQAYLAVAGGAVDIVLALGVEKFTDVVGNARLTALSTTMDADYEGVNGATSASIAALIMRRYMHEYGVELQDFAGFSVNAHANGALNPNAMFRNRLKPEVYPVAPHVASPVNLFDAAPEGDGAAALILAATEKARDMVPRPVQVLASAAATDTLSIHDRADLLYLSAANLSAGRAYEQAGFTPGDIDLFELHDSFTILSTLTLEASGFADPGAGWKLAHEDGIGLQGKIPISTFGGLKARGHAGGATGLYQLVEVAQQLRGEAGDNQIKGGKIGMAQNLGGLGATAITHILGIDSF